jgi:ABC-type uncharacterized transport system permease subunit
LREKWRKGGIVSERLKRDREGTRTLGCIVLVLDIHHIALLVVRSLILEAVVLSKWGRSTRAEGAEESCWKAEGVRTSSSSIMKSSSSDIVAVLALRRAAGGEGGGQEVQGSLERWGSGRECG